jgi:hypothetical protein
MLKGKTQLVKYTESQIWITTESEVWILVLLSPKKQIRFAHLRKGKSPTRIYRFGITPKKKASREQLRMSHVDFIGIIPTRILRRK